MKSLSNYTEQAITKALDDNGAFFAFSNEQLNKEAKSNIKYVALGRGLICPKNNVTILLQAFSDITADGIKQDLKENGINDIVIRELANYECFYTNDISDCVDALDEYGITKEQIEEIYQNEKHNFQ